MSEQQGVAAGAVAGAGEGQGGEAAAQQQGGGDARWQDKFLPEDMRSNETLANYKSIPDLAKAHVETQTWARGRIAVPKIGDQDFDARFSEFVAKVRPEKAEDYKILGSDGQPSEFGDSFRSVFHDVGLHPRQAEMLTTAWNQRQGDLISQAEQKGKDELTAIELELGTPAYNQRLQAVSNMLEAQGIDVSNLVPGMEQLSGSAGATMKALFALAEKTGELAKVDGVDVTMRLGALTPQAAQAELDSYRERAANDPEFAAKLADPNSQEAKRRKAVQAAAAKRG